MSLKKVKMFSNLNVKIVTCFFIYNFFKDYYSIEEIFNYFTITHWSEVRERIPRKKMFFLLSDCIVGS